MLSGLILGFSIGSNESQKLGCFFNRFEEYNHHAPKLKITPQLMGSYF
jgi:hypothetical protein